MVTLKPCKDMSNMLIRFLSPDSQRLPTTWAGLYDPVPQVKSWIQSLIHTTSTPSKVLILLGASSALGLHGKTFKDLSKEVDFHTRA